MPLVDTPVALAVTGTGRSSLERHRSLTADRSNRVRLTSLGQKVRAAYRPVVEAIEISWAAAPELRDALEALDVHSIGHADHPDVRYVGGRVGFTEASARR